MKVVSKTIISVIVTAMFGMPAMADDNNVKLEVNGALEVELGTSEDFTGTKGSDIALATVELGFDAQITPWVSAHILFLHEDDDTEPAEIDEGIITLANDDVTAFSLSAGRMYVPFGAYESNLVSDPLTLEIGETREAAVQLGFDSGLSASFFVFNGDTLEVGSDDNVEHFGFNIGFANETDAMAFDAGFSYISSIGDTDSLYDVVAENRLASAAATDEVVEFVAGFSVHGMLTMGALSFIAEYTTAADAFDATELPAFGGAQPSAYNVEAAFTMNQMTFAAAFQGTAEAVDLGLPETRFLIAASMEVVEGASLSVEYLTEEDYSVADGGTGETGNALTIQLATEF